MLGCPPVLSSGDRTTRGRNVGVAQPFLHLCNVSLMGFCLAEVRPPSYPVEVRLAEIRLAFKNRWRAEHLGCARGEPVIPDDPALVL